MAAPGMSSPRLTNERESPPCSSRTSRGTGPFHRGTQTIYLFAELPADSILIVDQALSLYRQAVAGGASPADDDPTSGVTALPGAGMSAAMPAIVMSGGARRRFSTHDLRS